MRCCATALTFLVASSVDARAAAPPRPGPVSSYEGAARVVDGDTLVVTSNGSTQRVRLYGIDAPESKQSCSFPNGSHWECGRRSTEALRKRVAGGRVHCVSVNTDRYGRDVALCDVGKADLASWMVRNGWALAYRAYGGKQFDAAEASAKKARVGVWQGEVTNPWEWRARQRSGGSGELRRTRD